ncbi:hypothetical protein MMC11_005498 [Xylographa trunciseda]|nr:hypothetical protein [Xylographa trunciseda]
MLCVLIWSLTVVLLPVLFAIFLIKSLRRQPRKDEEATLFANEKQAFLDHPPSHLATNSSRFEREGLPESITRSDSDTIERDAWVLRMVHHMFEARHQQHHNVVVINADLEYHFKPEGVVERFLIDYHNTQRPWVVSYEVVAFREGTLVNIGDGGDINWDWQGNFVRNGNRLLTFKPCVPGVVYKQDPWIAV